VCLGVVSGCTQAQRREMWGSFPLHDVLKN
jgi:hypothetical protein